ncbi:MAG: diphosphate--fructose-6-phosphate 1-phosphotransferase [Myxococcales bacterium]
MNQQGKRMAIVAGGGPAPGINSVIGGATIRAVLGGSDVIGINDGFRWIMEGNVEHVTPLTIDSVSRIHFRGGSFIGIARANPTKNEKHLENVVTSLLRLNVDRLITIGGDDTATSSYRVSEQSRGRIRVVHVPKTIDNDLNLPLHGNTFGFQTARHVGTGIVRDLMVDAKTTSRWYFVISMGRKVGHLALGMGKAAGATLSLIPEEFPNPVKLKTIVDTLVGAIIKRMAYGLPHGVAVLAEGLVESIDPKDLAEAGAPEERDAHGHLRIAEVDFGNIVKAKVQEQLKKYNVKTTVVAKNVGYELRCTDPVPYDMEYTRDLGYYAAKFLEEGGSGALVSIEDGKFKPLMLKDLLDPKTGKMAVRYVDVKSEGYKIAREYMIRLTRKDFEDAHELAKYAATAGITIDQFRSDFGYLCEYEPEPLMLFAPGKAPNSHLDVGMPTAKPEKEAKRSKEG